MNLLQFEDAIEFLALVEDYLLADECVNSLMLGICYRVRDGFYEEVEPLLAAVKADGILVATAVHTPPHALLVNVTHPNPKYVMRFLADALSDHDFPGVLGPIAAAEAFANARQSVTGRPYRVEMEQRVYELRRVNNLPYVPGQLRQAVRSDYEMLVEWMMGFDHDSFGRVDRKAVEKQVSRHLRAGNYYFWEDGRPLSVAAKVRESPHGRSISLVYTPPELRGQGYATACVAALSQMLLDEGAQFCTLFTDLNNPTSNSIYQKIGYRPVAEFNHYLFT